MTTPRDPDGSSRIDSGPSHPATTTGADVTNRMTGAPSYDQTTSRTQETVRPAPVQHTDTLHTPAPAGLGHYKTSAAAAFALVFGLAALFCALTAILSPAAVVFGIIGIILGIAGMKMAKRPHVTGRGVAIGGLVTAVLGLLLGGAVIGGATAIVNNQKALDRISTQVDKLKADLPSGNEVTNVVK